MYVKNHEILHHNLLIEAGNRHESSFSHKKSMMSELESSMKKEYRSLKRELLNSYACNPVDYEEFSNVMKLKVNKDEFNKFKLDQIFSKTDASETKSIHECMIILYDQFKGALETMKEYCIILSQPEPQAICAKKMRGLTDKLKVILNSTSSGYRRIKNLRSESIAKMASQPSFNKPLEVEMLNIEKPPIKQK